jgi:hypothetical protein
MTKKTLPDVWYRNPWAEIDSRDCAYCGSMSDTRHFARCPLAGRFEMAKVSKFTFDLENLRRLRLGRPRLKRPPRPLLLVAETRVRPLRSHSVAKVAERIANRT